jgi:hypothetical protein
MPIRLSVVRFCKSRRNWLRKSLNLPFTHLSVHHYIQLWIPRCLQRGWVWKITTRSFRLRSTTGLSAQRPINIRPVAERRYQSVAERSRSHRSPELPLTGYMYILECADGSYYTGSTKNLEKGCGSIVIHWARIIPAGNIRHNLCTLRYSPGLTKLFIGRSRYRDGAMQKRR